MAFSQRCTIAQLIRHARCLFDGLEELGRGPAQGRTFCSREAGDEDATYCISVIGCMTRNWALRTAVATDPSKGGTKQVCPRCSSSYNSRWTGHATTLSQDQGPVVEPQPRAGNAAMEAIIRLIRLLGNEPQHELRKEKVRSDFVSDTPETPHSRMPRAQAAAQSSPVERQARSAVSCRGRCSTKQPAKVTAQ